LKVGIHPNMIIVSHAFRAAPVAVHVPVSMIVQPFVVVQRRCLTAI
jgi:hypothetical protein